MILVQRVISGRYNKICTGCDIATETTTNGLCCQCYSFAMAYRHLQTASQLFDLNHQSAKAIP